MSTYNVTWKSNETVSASELPAEGLSLEQVAEIAKAEGVNAELHDEAGFTKGWVHADGTWKLA